MKNLSITIWLPVYLNIKEQYFRSLFCVLIQGQNFEDYCCEEMVNYFKFRNFLFILAFCFVFCKRVWTEKIQRYYPPFYKGRSYWISIIQWHGLNGQCWLDFRLFGGALSFLFQNLLTKIFIYIDNIMHYLTS